MGWFLWNCDYGLLSSIASGGREVAMEAGV